MRGNTSTDKMTRWETWTESKIATEGIASPVIHSPDCLCFPQFNLRPRSGDHYHAHSEPYCLPRKSLGARIGPKAIASSIPQLSHKASKQIRRVINYYHDYILDRRSIGEKEVGLGHCHVDEMDGKIWIQSIS